MAPPVRNRKRPANNEPQINALLGPHIPLKIQRKNEKETDAMPNLRQPPPKGQTGASGGTQPIEPVVELDGWTREPIQV